MHTRLLIPFPFLCKLWDEDVYGCHVTSHLRSLVLSTVSPVDVDLGAERLRLICDRTCWLNTSKFHAVASCTSQALRTPKPTSPGYHLSDLLQGCNAYSRWMSMGLYCNCLDTYLITRIEIALPWINLNLPARASLQSERRRYKAHSCLALKTPSSKDLFETSLQFVSSFFSLFGLFWLVCLLKPWSSLQIGSDSQLHEVLLVPGCGITVAVRHRNCCPLPKTEIAAIFSYFLMMITTMLDGLVTDKLRWEEILLQTVLVTWGSWLIHVHFHYSRHETPWNHKVVC